MKTIEGKQAVDYLERARSCIHPEDCLNQLQIVGVMLDIERVYLEKLTNSGLSDMAKITIMPSGFPEMGSWLVDIGEAFKQYDQMRAKRAKELTPLLSAAKNFNRDSIIEKSRKIASGFSQEFGLSSVLHSLSEEQRRYCTEELIKELLSSKQAGLLSGKDSKSPFQNPNYPTWHGIRHNSETAGFKYLDSQEPGILGGPLLLYVASDFRYLQVANPKHSLVSLRHWIRVGECECNGTKEHCDMTSYKDFLDEDQKILKEFELSFSRLNTSLKRALVLSDLTSVGSIERLEFFDALFQADSVVKKFKDVCADFVNGAPLDGDQFTSENESFALKINDLSNSLSSDELKKTLQLGCAGALDEVADLADMLVKKTEAPTSTQEAQVLVPRKKRFFLF